MIKYYTSSTYRKHYSDLENLNMINEGLEVEPYQLSLYVLRNYHKDKSRVSSKGESKEVVGSNGVNDPQKCFTDLIEDLQVFKNVTMTPIKAFKSLLLIHCTFLLYKITPNQDNVDKLNSYFKWILEETLNMIQNYSNKENKKRNGSTDKKEGFLARSAKSLKFFNPQSQSKQKVKQRPKSSGKSSQEQILCKQMCLLSNIVKPYILYLQKILAIYPQYQSLMRSIQTSTQTSSDPVWTVLNIFKLMVPIVSIFVYIGRYFYKDYCQIVHLLIEFFSKQVNRLYPVLRNEVKRRTQKIEHEWFVLQAKYSEYEIIHNPQIQIQGVDDAMLLVDEILKINDNLFHIFYVKHFYSFVEKLKLPSPRWLQINSNDCEFLIRYVEARDRTKRKKSLRASSKDKGGPDSSAINLPPSITTKKTTRVNNLIDKKTLLPQTKKTLKLNDTPREEPITFRVLDNNEVKKNSFGEISFSNEISTERTSNGDDLSNKN